MTERVRPKYVRRHIATRDGALLPTTDVQLVFDHLPAKGKNVDWKAAAHQLGEDLLKTEQALGMSNQEYNNFRVEVYGERDTWRTYVANVNKMRAYLRSSWVRFFIPRHLWSA